MTHFDVDAALKTLVCCVDSRERLATSSVHKRLSMIGLPLHREALSFGDYSCYCTVDGKVVSLKDKVAIERKMSLDELSGNLFQNRERFKREFERAKKANAKIYLLIENGSMDKVMDGKYKTRVHPNSYLASILAWLSRYNCQVIFCKPEHSGRLIGEILRREMKEYLMGLVDDGEK